MKRSRKVRIAGLLVGLLALGMFSGISPANAVAPLPILCNLQAIVNVSPGTGTGPQNWSISMAGDCSGDLDGPYFASGGAFGTSTGSGFCGGLLVNSLDLTAFLFLNSFKGTAWNKLLIEKWVAPVTTFPIATPFLIAGINTPSGNATTGVGSIFTRLRGPLGGCPGSAGSSNAGITLTIRTT